MIILLTLSYVIFTIYFGYLHHKAIESKWSVLDALKILFWPLHIAIQFFLDHRGDGKILK